MFTTPAIDSSLIKTRDFLDKLDDLCYYKFSIRTSFRVAFENKLSYLYLWGRVKNGQVCDDCTFTNKLTHYEREHDYGFILQVGDKRPISGLLHWSGPASLVDAEERLNKSGVTTSWEWSTHT